jgi:class 3 adenylate cyclase
MSRCFRLESSWRSCRRDDALPCLPKHLADKILQSKSALDGERQRVTVLFADVEASRELTKRSAPRPRVPTRVA